MSKLKTEHRKVAHKAAKIFLEKNGYFAGQDARARKRMTRELELRLMRELPGVAFARKVRIVPPLIQRPGLIIPDIQIEADGIDLMPKVQQSRGPIILTDDPKPTGNKLVLA